MPGMENRMFAATIYPDGSPAACDIHVWMGRKSSGKPFARVKTNEAGLVEFRLTPRPEQFRPGPGGEATVEMLGGHTAPFRGPSLLLDLFTEAQDGKGQVARTRAEVNSDPLGENVLLRLDKAVYKGGESLKVEVRSSAGLSTAYLDLVRGG